MASLARGQTLRLDKPEGGALTRVRLGLGWDVRRLGGLRGLFGGRDGTVKLSAACLIFGEDHLLIDAIWFRHRSMQDGSIVHNSIKRSRDGDDEQILVDLTALPESMATLVFTMNSFSGDTFERIEKSHWRMVNATTTRELARFDMAGGGDHTGQVMACISRTDGNWQMKAIGEKADGRTFHDMIPVVLRNI